MGMYNNVELKIKCKKCGSILQGQTKDSDVEVASKSGRKFELNNGFYTVFIEDISEGSVFAVCLNYNCALFQEFIIYKVKDGKILE